MKKITVAILTMLALLFAFTACTDLTEVDYGSGNTGGGYEQILENEDEDAVVLDSLVTARKDGYVFVYEEYTVAVGSLASDLLEALGEPQDTFVDESCAFYGKDYTYFYPGVRFYTFSPAEGMPDYILSIVFGDDTVMTAEGAYIGMTREEIEEIYGEPTNSDEAGGIEYIKDGMSLSFMFDNDDMVDYITYYYDEANEFEVVN